MRARCLGTGMMGIAALNPSCGLARRFLENAGNQDVQSASGRNARIAPDFLNRATLLTNRATICSNRATNWRDSSIRSGGDHGTDADAFPDRKSTRLDSSH